MRADENLCGDGYAESVARNTFAISVRDINKFAFVVEFSGQVQIVL